MENLKKSLYSYGLVHLLRRNKYFLTAKIFQVEFVLCDAAWKVFTAVGDLLNLP